MGPANKASLVEMRMDLSKIIIAETGEQQVIWLSEREGQRQFPIVIGMNEVLAIDRRVKGQRPVRPLTHELLASVIEALGAELERIVIHDLQDHTFYAKLVLRVGSELKEIDSRPSDAIALGVAIDTPIYVEEHVLNTVAS
jgi:bifunctional DNase/RNase